MKEHFIINAKNYMNTREVIKYILSEYKKFNDWNDNLQEFGIDITLKNKSEFCVGDVLVDIIYKIYEIPEDNSVGLDFDDKDYFCRDCFGDRVHEFINDEIKEDDFFYFFENWKELFDNSKLFNDFIERIKKD